MYKKKHIPTKTYTRMYLFNRNTQPRHALECMNRNTQPRHIPECMNKNAQPRHIPECRIEISNLDISKNV